MRELLIEQMYKLIKLPYQLFFKNKKPWPHTIQDLIVHPPDTLGFHLGCFLLKYNFDLQPSLEEHDVFHVLTKAGTSVRNEIEMQFDLLGNGKKSLFVFIVVTTGIIFYPAHATKFYYIYKKGQEAHRFYHLNFQQLLNQPIINLQKALNILPI